MTKTADEIKKGLECCYSPVEPMLRCEECPYHGSVVCKMRVHTDALAYIQQLEAQNSELLKNIEQLQAELRDAKKNHQHTIDIAERQKVQIGKLKSLIVKMNKESVPSWISVEERLPEEKEDVAAIIRYNANVWEYGVAFRMNESWHMNGTGRVEVTHWMPLPEPPAT